MRAPSPPDESARLLALASCNILDSAAEPAFDELVKLASHICATPYAMVSLVDGNRQWFKARVGFPVAEEPREVSFCAHALERSDPLIVPDTRLDPRFADNASVTKVGGLRFYAGVPLRLDGSGSSALGTLCVADVVPRTLTPPQVDALVTLARRVEIEMRLRRDLARAPSSARVVATASDATADTMYLPPAADSDAEAAPADANTSSIHPGATLGERYAIGKRIGKGGMAEVFAARDAQSGSRVAVKCLAPSLFPRAEKMDRFAREAQVLLRIDDPHVARILDVGNSERGAPFIVMEYVEGHDLAKLLPARMKVPDAVDIVLQATRGISAAHARGVVHRDLKPANLIMSRGPNGENVVKIVDFGIAKLVGDAAPNVALTAAGEVFGSALYMSPEQMLASRTVDEQTDVWALGAILYEILAGEPPFNGPSLTAICAAVFAGVPKPLAELRPDIPPALDRVAMRCLARDKSSRWPSAQALEEALVAIARELPSPA